MTKYKITRDVTSAECSWIPGPFLKGEIYEKASGCTYGVISPDGVALKVGKIFVECPRDAVGEIADDEPDQ